MAYAPPTITAAGLTIPSYNDILNYLLTGFRAIYGQNVYLGTDSGDYQLLAIVALAIYDNMNGLVLIYGQRSPVTAIGTGLDAIVKMNGIVRRSATNSTATLTLTGTINTVINNGAVSDINNYLWSLPSPTTLTGSTTTVTATCQTAGNITANAGTITNIATPTGGWTGATNPSAAIPGQPIEADSSLRARQAVSAAGPSSTTLDGTISDVAAVEGVTRYNILENSTGSTDGYGNPAHSITAVVEGGDQTAIADAIYYNKGIGPTVNGTNPASGATLITVPITDPQNGGLTQTIYFFRPGDQPIYTSVFIEVFSGYTSANATNIQTAVQNYLSGLQIGQPILYSEVYWAVVNSQPSQSTPIFSLKGLYTGLFSGGVCNVGVTAGGTGYFVNSILTITTGGNNAQLIVTSVGAGGVITALEVRKAYMGTGYTVGAGQATTGGSGTGCTVNVISIGGTLAEVLDISLSFYQVAQFGSCAVAVVTTW